MDETSAGLVAFCCMRRRFQHRVRTAGKLFLLTELANGTRNGDEETHHV
jgi:hypothetical protein